MPDLRAGPALAVGRSPISARRCSPVTSRSPTAGTARPSSCWSAGAGFASPTRPSSPTSTRCTARSTILRTKKAPTRAARNNGPCSRTCSASSRRRGRCSTSARRVGCWSPRPSARGLDAVGVEPSAPLASGARARGLDVRTGVLPLAELDGRRFDVVTLVDVIEHVADPLVAAAGGPRRTSPTTASCSWSRPTSRASPRASSGSGGGTCASRTSGTSTGRRWPTRSRARGCIPVRWWRPGWVFEVGYLAERVSTYVPPVQRLVTRAGDAPALHWTVPLNPRDSLAVIARGAR